MRRVSSPPNQERWANHGKDEAPGGPGHSGGPSLGSTSKPAISHELDPLLHSWGLPNGLSYGISFALAMILVVFLHMVVGEMAPKSWAIAHPERSAMLLAPPYRSVAKVVRPLIWLLNKVSNALARLCKVFPRDELTEVHNREQLTQLVAESERLGLISKDDSELITSSLVEPPTPVGGLQIPAHQLISVAADVDADTILATAADRDHNSLLVRDNALVVGSVHARDTLIARPRGRAVTARELSRSVPELSTTDTAGHAMGQLRRRRAPLTVVGGDTGRLMGLVTLGDLLARLTHPQAA